MDGGPSFASRRPAATALPAFSLPPPDISSTRNPASASAVASVSTSGALPMSSTLDGFRTSATSTSQYGSDLTLPSPSQSAPRPPISHNLTPSSGVTNDGLSPLSSGVNTGSSMSSQHSTGTGQSGAYYGHMSGSWPGPGGYTFNGPSNTHNQVTSPLLQQPFSAARSWNQSQQLSPSIPQFGHSQSSSGRQHMTSPPVQESLPRPQSYEQSSPVFLTPISGHGGGGGGAGQSHSQMMSSHSQGQGQDQSTAGGGPPPDYRSTQQQQQAQVQQQQQQQQHQQHEQQRQQHQVQYGSYTPSSTPQQANFPTFQSNQNAQSLPSPTGRAPTSANSSSMNAGSRAVASITQQQQGGPMSGMAPPMSYGGSRQPLPLSYQQMPPSILSNLHQPGNPMSMMGSVGHGIPGGYQSGPPHHAHLHMYPSQHTQQTHTDRPYKCDQCHQSFSRNHDLKRHKKIHLAVKPFPCDACEKSFSRKDALKRHRMVKGCGEGLGNINGRKGSPPDKSDVLSDSTEGSPTIKKEMADRR